MEGCFLAVSSCHSPQTHIKLADLIVHIDPKTHQPVNSLVINKFAWIVLSVWMDHHYKTAVLVSVWNRYDWSHQTRNQRRYCQRSWLCPPRFMVNPMITDPAMKTSVLTSSTLPHPTVVLGLSALVYGESNYHSPSYENLSSNILNPSPPNSRPRFVRPGLWWIQLSQTQLWKPQF